MKRKSIIDYSHSETDADDNVSPSTKSLVMKPKPTSSSLEPILEKIMNECPLEDLHQTLLRACWKRLASKLDPERRKTLEAGHFIPFEYLNEDGTVIPKYFEHNKQQHANRSSSSSSSLSNVQQPSSVNGVWLVNANDFDLLADDSPVIVAFEASAKNNKNVLSNEALLARGVDKDGVAQIFYQGTDETIKSILSELQQKCDIKDKKDKRQDLKTGLKYLILLFDSRLISSFEARYEGRIMIMDENQNSPLLQIRALQTMNLPAEVYLVQSL